VQVSFLFWNLQRRGLQVEIAVLALQHDVSVLILAECKIDPSALLLELASVGLREFTYQPSVAGEDGDIRMFSRVPECELRSLYDDPNNHIAARRMVFARTRDLLLVVVHSQSKQNWSEDDQTQGAIRLARRIAELEVENGHRRTLLVGDLNMNPFEKGVIGSEGLHAVMTKGLASPEFRVVDAEERHFFYNPMWRFFGERADGPPGTHFYPAAGKPVAFFWNMFDQVMLRPQLMNALVVVKIIDRIGNEALLDNRGLPRRDIGSDHLPLFFVLNLD
jgi:exonuclease III